MSLVDLVIFGGTGDLSTRKLLPALFQLQRHGLADSVQRIIATGRAASDSETFKREVHGNLQRFLAEGQWYEAVWATFAEKLEYQQLEAQSATDYEALTAVLEQKPAQRLFYLATLPSLYGPICDHLHSAGAVREDSGVVLEKPLGHNLASCREINEQVARVFPEEATFRIDHYLGKETVQNLLAVRFGNPLLQPVWENSFVDNVQITVGEEIGVEGRHNYYAQTGALRDMVQNHLLQVLSIVAMEPPASLKPADIRDEKEKVLRSLEPITAENVKSSTVRGVYGPGAVNGEAVKGFNEEAEYADIDSIETFVAVKATINNWRWAGVPFYLRTGKRLTRRYSEIVIEFKRQPFSLFANDPNELTNKLVIRLQPEETITLHTLNKRPGLSRKLRLQPVALHLTDESQDKSDRYDAYERLLLDAINGEQTLFMRRDEVETAWQWVDSIIEAWDEVGMAIKNYNSGTMGPSSATALTERDGRSWYE
ncbi:MAG: glucose-6-phosphate dehydrogenase [Pseudomonadota bacterium]